MTTYLLAGGGTAGHVNPLLALAEYIRDVEPDSEILVLGTQEGLESKLVPERGFELITIARLPFPRKPSIYALNFPVKYSAAIKAIQKLIRDRGVEIVVGFGGYASAPAYRAAAKSGVPYVIHEANAKPGLANLMGARQAAAVAVTFQSTPIKKAEVTGMPLRREIETLDREAKRFEARKHFGLQADLFTLLITGGSLGARAINEALSQKAEEITAAGLQVLHIWGGLTTLKDPGVSGYQVIKYCDRMDLAFAAADAVVSRAGSTAVSEITALGLPAIYVPYGSGNGEQRLNAADAVSQGAAKIYEDKEITGDWVQGVLLPTLLTENKLAAMAANSKKIANPNGTRNLFRVVKRELQQRSTQ